MGEGGVILLLVTALMEFYTRLDSLSQAQVIIYSITSTTLWCAVLCHLSLLSPCHVHSVFPSFSSFAPCLHLFLLPPIMLPSCVILHLPFYFSVCFWCSLQVFPYLSLCLILCCCSSFPFTLIFSPALLSLLLFPPLNHLPIHMTPHSLFATKLILFSLLFCPLLLGL